MSNHSTGLRPTRPMYSAGDERAPCPMVCAGRSMRGVAAPGLFEPDGAPASALDPPNPGWRRQALTVRAWVRMGEEHGTNGRNRRPAAPRSSRITKALRRRVSCRELMRGHPRLRPALPCAASAAPPEATPAPIRPGQADIDRACGLLAGREYRAGGIAARPRATAGLDLLAESPPIVAQTNP